MARIGAVSRLAFARHQHPVLVRLEAEARADLAGAIMTLDEAEDADVPNTHTMNEQVAVETATRAYAQALANLVRGEEP